MPPVTPSASPRITSASPIDEVSGPLETLDLADAASATGWTGPPGRVSASAGASRSAQALPALAGLRSSAGAREDGEEPDPLIRTVSASVRARLAAAMQGGSLDPRSPEVREIAESLRASIDPLPSARQERGEASSRAERRGLEPLQPLHDALAAMIHAWDVLGSDVDGGVFEHEFLALNAAIQGLDRLSGANAGPPADVVAIADELRRSCARGMLSFGASRRQALDTALDSKKAAFIESSQLALEGSWTDSASSLMQSNASSFREFADMAGEMIQIQDLMTHFCLRPFDESLRAREHDSAQAFTRAADKLISMLALRGLERAVDLQWFVCILADVARKCLDLSKDPLSKPVRALLDRMAEAFQLSAAWEAETSRSGQVNLKECDLLGAVMSDLAVKLTNLGRRMRTAKSSGSRDDLAATFRHAGEAMSMVRVMIDQQAGHVLRKEGAPSAGFMEKFASLNDKRPLPLPPSSTLASQIVEELETLQAGEEPVPVDPKRTGRKHQPAWKRAERSERKKRDDAQDRRLRDKAYERAGEILELREDDPVHAWSISDAHLAKACKDDAPVDMNEAEDYQEDSARTLENGIAALRDNIRILKLAGSSIEELEKDDPDRKDDVLTKAASRISAWEKDVVAMEARLRMLRAKEWSSREHRPALFVRMPTYADRIALEDDGLLSGWEQRVRNPRRAPDKNLRVWIFELPDGRRAEHHMYLDDAGRPWASHSETAEEGPRGIPGKWHGRTPRHLLEEDLRRLEALAARSRRVARNPAG